MTSDLSLSLSCSPQVGEGQLAGQWTGGWWALVGYLHTGNTDQRTPPSAPSMHRSPTRAWDLAGIAASYDIDMRLVHQQRQGSQRSPHGLSTIMRPLEHAKAWPEGRYLTCKEPLKEPLFPSRTPSMPGPSGPFTRATVQGLVACSPMLHLEYHCCVSVCTYHHHPRNRIDIPQTLLLAASHDHHVVPALSNSFSPGSPRPSFPGLSQR